ncbi:MAG TPA: transglycosylase domain-containing protein [Solirubrobacterales bacterium]|nr:transglycosylase domain-containing protein [Solirubrobacterales bacterium]
MAVSLLKRRRSDGGEIPPAPPAVPFAPGAPGPPKRTKPRLKKLRFLFVLLGLGILAVISMIFGMMAAVSQDLPAIYNFARYKASKNSVVVDSSGRTIGTLSSDQNKILLSSGQISPNIKNAVVSIEDARFYEHAGVDFRGIGRALVEDVLSQSAQQGASTITEQFVKNALEAEGSRTVLEKFREAALAYKLEKHWSKEKILTEYLNTIYFGEGAYGIEAAAQTYFGAAHPGCGTESEPCAAVLEPWEAAMLAGIIASPSAFDPKIYPENALGRRNLVLEKMYEQGYITHEQYVEGIHKALPAPADIKPPTLESKAPYFTAYLRQQLVERYGPEKAYFGGLQVKATLDLKLQGAAEEAVSSYLGYSPATASVVVIDDHNGGIKAMVGGPNFEKAPFNLATQGRRQPGSSIKPFTLLTALEEGISPDTEFPSEQRTFHFGKHGGEAFTVHNDEEGYLGSCSIACGLTYSDNSIYAGLGLEGLEGKTIEDRTRSIAKTIHKAGYTGSISTNPAMVLGGLKEGVSPTGWAYAYSTIGNDGDRISGTLAPSPGDSPVAFTEVTKNGKPIKGGENHPIHHQVFDEETVKEQKGIMETVIAEGTGTAAQTGAPEEWGKTGTTEEEGDAWFCGGIAAEVTACVWVGYPDTTTPMLTLFNGGPVMGGTYPALIWARVMTAWEEIKKEHLAEKKAKEKAKEAKEDEGKSSAEAEEEVEAGEYEEPEYTAPEETYEGEEFVPEEEAEGGTGGRRETEAPVEEAPEEATPEEVTPERAPEETAPVTPATGGGVTAG